MIFEVNSNKMFSMPCSIWGERVDEDSWKADCTPSLPSGEERLRVTGLWCKWNLWPASREKLRAKRSGNTGGRHWEKSGQERNTKERPQWGGIWGPKQSSQLPVLCGSVESPSSSHVMGGCWPGKGLRTASCLPGSAEVLPKSQCAEERAESDLGKTRAPHSTSIRNLLQQRCEGSVCMKSHVGPPSVFH